MTEYNVIGFGRDKRPVYETIELDDGFKIHPVDDGQGGMNFCVSQYGTWVDGSYDTETEAREACNDD